METETLREAILYFRDRDVARQFVALEYAGQECACGSRIIDHQRSSGRHVVSACSHSGAILAQGGRGRGTGAAILATDD